MKLVRPTDFQILAALLEHGRNNGANLSVHLDKDRQYVNTRLPALADYGLVAKVGPHERSGLYEITETGRRAVEHRDEYPGDEFESLVDAPSED